MPRLRVPRSTRTMYGNVTPALVVVEATKAAGAVVDRHRGFGPIEQMEFGRDVALRIDGKRRQAARVRCWRVAHLRDGRRRGADPWRRLRAEQHRSADRVVGDLQLFRMA